MTPASRHLLLSHRFLPHICWTRNKTLLVTDHIFLSETSVSSLGASDDGNRPIRLPRLWSTVLTSTTLYQDTSSGPLWRSNSGLHPSFPLPPYLGPRFQNRTRRLYPTVPSSPSRLLVLAQKPGSGDVTGRLWVTYASHPSTDTQTLSLFDKRGLYVWTPSIGIFTVNFGALTYSSNSVFQIQLSSPGPGDGHFTRLLWMWVPRERSTVHLRGSLGTLVRLLAPSGPPPRRSPAPVCPRPGSLVRRRGPASRRPSHCSGVLTQKYLLSLGHSLIKALRAEC